MADDGGADIQADPDVLRRGARRLMALSGELGVLAAQLRELPVRSAELARRRDALLDAVSGHIVELAVSAGRIGAHADALAGHDERTAGALDRIARALR